MRRAANFLEELHSLYAYTPWRADISSAAEELLSKDDIEDTVAQVSTFQHASGYRRFAHAAFKPHGSRCISALRAFVAHTSSTI